MRPKIPENLADRIKAEYEDAGYANESEFVRDSIRRRLEQIETTLRETEETNMPRLDLFELTGDGVKYSSTADVYNVYLKPKRNSGLEIKYIQKGNPPHYVELRADEETIRESDLKEAFQNVAGVEKAVFLTDEIIRIDVKKDTERPFSQLVRESFDTLYELVGRGTIDEIEMERAQRLNDAVREYTAS